MINLLVNLIVVEQAPSSRPQRTARPAHRYVSFPAMQLCVALANQHRLPEVEINPLDPEDVDVAMVELTALTPLVPNLRFLTLYYVPDEDEIHMRSSTRDAWLTIPWSQDLIRKLRKFLDAEFRQVEVVRLKHHLPMDSETGR